MVRDVIRGYETEHVCGRALDGLRNVELQPNHLLLPDIAHSVQTATIQFAPYDENEDVWFWDGTYWFGR